MNLTLEKLKYEAEQAGPEGTKAFDMELRRLKVAKCRELKGFFYCSACLAFEDCTLLKEHLRDLEFGESDEQRK